MWVVDLDKKVVHDMSSQKYECRISKIPNDRKKKLHTKIGMEHFLNDQMNKDYKACQFCMPEYFTFDMGSIFQ